VGGNSMDTTEINYIVSQMLEYDYLKSRLNKGTGEYEMKLIKTYFPEECKWFIKCENRTFNDEVLVKMMNRRDACIRRDIQYSQMEFGDVTFELQVKKKYDKLNK
jgi:hypothetical protein